MEDPKEETTKEGNASPRPLKTSPKKMELPEAPKRGTYGVLPPELHRGDLISGALIPSKVEFTSLYRGGLVTSITFEGEGFHLCYGVSKEGEIFDPCLLTSEETILEEGEASPKVVKFLQSFLQERQELFARRSEV